MKKIRFRPTPRSVVLVATATLFALWVVLHLRQLTATQNGTVRFFLTMLFSFAILLRPKPDKKQPRHKNSGWPQPQARHSVALRLSFLAVIPGALMVIFGLVFNVHQLEWFGLLILCFACLKWALPAAYSGDIPLALILLYWAHPLPAQVFGPFQLTMQKLSVQGSEWLLHLCNVRVWADGLVLRTEMTVCEVPQWCSGMRTATTVFLLGLGLGILKRFKWYSCALLVAAFVAQALVLNVLRISAVVVLTPRLTEITSVQFLHNTMGMVVITGILLIYLEIALLTGLRRKRSRAPDQQRYAHDDLITEHPPFWQSMLARRWIILAGVVAIILVAGVSYKSRPYHRMRMIGDLAIALLDSGRYEEAEKAVDLVRTFWPDDDEWKLTRVRLLLARHMYEGVIAALDDLSDSSPVREVQKKVLRAYSLMGLARLEEAAIIVEELPEVTKRSDPRAAMILAEIAFHADQPDAVAEHVVTASRWLPNTARIRMLYPYLRTYRKWDAIRKSDLKGDYTEPVEALSATEAYMNLNEVPVVAGMVLQAMTDWPLDLRILEPLFFLAVKRSRGEWETHFAKHLVRSVNATRDPDRIYPLFERCFELSRPDLAWFLFRRIRELDPEHPALSLVLSRYGHKWFQFRKRFLGFPAGRARDTMNVSTLFLVGRCSRAWQAWCRLIPSADMLSATDTLAARKQQLREALARFDARGAKGRLSLVMHYEYVYALEMAGEVDGARQELQRLSALHPAEKHRARVCLSEIYERKADWQNVYETLRGYTDSRQQQLAPLLRLCRAQRRLHLGIAAICTARQVMSSFPNSTEVATMLAETLMAYDSAEEALLVLSRPRLWHRREVDVLTTRVLQRTQRYTEAEAVCRSAMLPRLPFPRGTVQQMFLPPAELSILWHRVSFPSNRDFERNAAAIRTNTPTVTSPYLRGMFSLWLDCYHNGCAATAAEIDRWEACGRDNLEKATVLHQLTLLLCRQGEYDAARGSAERAVQSLPQSPTLWRVLISLANGDADVIERACSACPQDSRIWLAALVTATRPTVSEESAADDGQHDHAGRLNEDQVVQHLSGLVHDKEPVLSAAAMTRAGEYLYRIGMRRAACVAARTAAAGARGLLPAYVLAVKCALIDQDKEWALSATKQAISASPNPPPLFYKKLVELKNEGGLLDIDPEMVEALRNLRREEPNNPLWAEMLGYVRYKRGGWEIVDALTQMADALRHGAVSKRAYVIAAEAARLLGNHERAGDLLRQGLKRYPRDLVMRNNLAFVLSSIPESIEEAIAIAETLYTEAPDDVRIKDTLAVTYMQAGKFDRAGKIVMEVLSRVPQRSNPWFRAMVHQAGIAVALQNPGQAIEILTEVLTSAEGIANRDILKAHDLLAQARDMQEKLRKAQPQRTNQTANTAPRSY